MKILVILLLIKSMSALEQAQLDQISRDSYNKVAALVMSFFSEHCKLGLQNCIFQTQWDHLFSKDKLFYSGVSILSVNTNNNSNNKKRSSNYDFHTNTTYHYCKAFIVAKFCIDDYVPKLEDYAECFNASYGNKADEFKRAVDLSECKPHFDYYLNSFNLVQINSCFICFLIISNLLLFNLF